jgi:hypothetical protein
MRIVYATITRPTKNNDPVIDVNLEWWVYLAAAVVGAIIGGIIAGVIGAIVGAILVPLIMWIAEQQLDGLINDVAHRIGEVLRQLNLNVDIEAVGLNIVFQQVHIDDIVIGSDVVVKTDAPIKSEGVITVKNGQWFDLDNGSIGDSTLASADMALEATNEADPPARRLRTLCCSRLARTGSSAFDIPRHALYGLDYDSPVAIQDTELTHIIPFPNLPWVTFPTIYIPSLLVYAVQTSEQRFSIIQVVEVREDHVKIRYRTFEKPVPRVRIVGEFKVEELGLGITPGSGIAGADIALDKARFVPVAMTAESAAMANRPAMASARLPTCDERPKVQQTSPGKWQTHVIRRRSKVGRFRAAVQNLHPSKYQWSINRTDLTANVGSVNLQGVAVGYTIEGAVITLRPDTNEKFDFELGVKVFAEDGSSVTTARCIEVAGTERVIKTVPATWAVYQEAFNSAFGSLEVAHAAGGRTGIR